MKLIYPDYLPQFLCLAGKCPDTCCKDWQIILDPDTLARYQKLPGELGADIRAALITEDGQTRFRLINSHCPLLDADGLCRIQRTLGLGGLCTTCRCHPRFIEEYGATREISLSLSCPSAAALILNREMPIAFLTETTAEQVSEYNELDPQLYLALVSIRERLFSILHARDLSLDERLGLCLLLCVRAQRLLDEGRYDALMTLQDRFSSSAQCQRPLARVRRLLRRPADFFPCWMVLNNMEHLTQEFSVHLERLSTGIPSGSLSAMQEENLAVYFLFRHILKAVNDGELLSRMESCVFHVLCIRRLCRNAGSSCEQLRAAALYSKEVEHSEDNCAMLRRVFRRGALRPGQMIQMLSG